MSKVTYWKGAEDWQFWIHYVLNTVGLVAYTYVALNIIKLQLISWQFFVLGTIFYVLLDRLIHWILQWD
jgi:hypothetical protein